MKTLARKSRVVALVLALALAPTGLIFGSETCGIASCFANSCGGCGNADCNGCNGCDIACDLGCSGNSICGSKLFGIYPIEERDDLGYNIYFGEGCQKTAVWVGGWAESGIMGNSHGSRSNGPMHTEGNNRTDYNLDQLYLFAEKELDTSNGFDWGFRLDTLYGTDGPITQSYGDESFDYGWGSNSDGYGLSLYQMIGAVGYKNLTVRGGKFYTPIGWEGVASQGNFFYSHSYCYWIEPSTHVGFTADYALNDKLTLIGGWTAGCENGFENRFGDNGMLFGAIWNATENSTFYYYTISGKTHNGWLTDLDDYKLGQDVDYQDYWVQSLCWEWAPTDRFTYVMQYNVRNDSLYEIGTGARSNYSSYGINNHFLYRINDCWGIGLRAEWLRDNGGYGYIDPSGDSANYYETTLGLKWDPNKHWSIRPEIRYDWADGAAKPFDDGTASNQLSAGLGVLLVF